MKRVWRLGSTVSERTLFYVHCVDVRAHQFYVLVCSPRCVRSAFNDDCTSESAHKLFFRAFAVLVAIGGLALSVLFIDLADGYSTTGIKHHGGKTSY